MIKKPSLLMNYAIFIQIVSIFSNCVANYYYLLNSKFTYNFLCSGSHKR